MINRYLRAGYGYCLCETKLSFYSRLLFKISRNVFGVQSVTIYSYQLLLCTITKRTKISLINRRMTWKFGQTIARSVCNVQEQNATFWKFSFLEITWISWINFSCNYSKKKIKLQKLTTMQRQPNCCWWRGENEIILKFFELELKFVNHNKSKVWVLFLVQFCQNLALPYQSHAMLFF